MSFRLTVRLKERDVLWSLNSVSLTGRRVPRLDGVTLDLSEGMTAVLGQSGAGKTSLLNILVGFERPSSGRVIFHKAASTDRLSVFWAPPQHGLWSHLTVREHLTTVSTTGNDRPADLEQELLTKLDLLEQADSKPDSLSLGERSRVNVARALASMARVLVMDEPLSHIDSGRCGKYWKVVREHCASTGTSLVFSTHAPDVVLREAEHVVCLADGRVSYAGGTIDLYERPSSKELALMLGPCNWLTLSDARHWCQLNAETPSSREPAGVSSESCIRPEQLLIEPAIDSPFRIEESSFAGSSAELAVRDERSREKKSFVYRPRGTVRFQQGDRVILKLLSLMMMLVIAGLSGCNGDISPPLRVKRETNWMMPPDGPRVPAPRGMTVSLANEYLVLDNAGRVLVFDEYGDLVRKWWMPEYSVGKAEGICVLKDGRIAVADTHYHRVVFFDHDGNVAGMFGQRGSGPGDFVYPVKITQDPEENLYVCEYGQNDRVQKFRPDGTWISQFGGPGTGPGQFQRPSGIVWYDHRLYVVDAFNNRIQVFTEDGKLVEILGDSDRIAEVHYPYDIAVDQNGDLHVVEYGADRVSKFSRKGKLLGRYGKSGTGQTTAQLKTPWGLAIDHRGRLYVCDTGNRRIVELEL